MSTPPALTDFPTFPDRNTADADAYVADASAWGGAMPGWTDDVRDLSDWMSGQANELASGFLLPLMLTFTFDPSTTIADPGDGELRINAGLTAIAADNLDNLGMSTTARLGRLNSTSAIKGEVAVYKAGDPTARLLGDVTLATAASGYYNLALSNVTVLGDAFEAGDALIMSIQVTGDKGDTGATGPTSNWTLDTSYTVSGSPSLITFMTPPGYNDLKFEFDGIVFSTSTGLLGAASTNGSTFGTAAQLVSGYAGAFGVVSVMGYRGDISGGLPCLSATTVSSPNGSSSGTGSFAQWKHTGGMAAFQFSLGAGNFTNVGTVKMFKR